MHDPIGVSAHIVWESTRAIPQVLLRQAPTQSGHPGHDRTVRDGVKKHMKPKTGDIGCVECGKTARYYFSGGLCPSCQMEIDANTAVSSIVEDISDRRGLKWEWGGIDSDIQDEIKRVWASAICDAFKDWHQQG
jgi:hypothetical protein